ncbi:ERI1 exoribonuclease 3 isoform X3 [Rhincodon typus]|nr:ERI1 exoribonuclease 3 isoform X3 [Rhincodon typus]XP_048458357.1 ERI1 exoribonuclease 3 isoform X3 [Rhincodon typus]XP_048458358.1 ERI1 exoribonuclease 3 isoform X3 [Rhincodon typus]
MLQFIPWIRRANFLHILYRGSGLGRSSVFLLSSERTRAEQVSNKWYSDIHSPTLCIDNNMASVQQPSSKQSFHPQTYHNFLVLDFEATCDKQLIKPQEIIEFPILKLHGRTLEIEAVFHTYVQPVIHSELTPFCTELTGIVQSMVDGKPTLQQALQMVDDWMRKEGLLDPKVNSIFVTCGDWDLKTMLPGQCQLLGLPVPDYFKKWINLKKAYSFAMGDYPKSGLPFMIKGLNLQHIGKLHSGIETSKNMIHYLPLLRIEMLILQLPRVISHIVIWNLRDFGSLMFAHRVKF